MLHRVRSVTAEQKYNGEAQFLSGASVPSTARRTIEASALMIWKAMTLKSFQKQHCDIITHGLHGFSGVQFERQATEK
jgi:hypothetical protein